MQIFICVACLIEYVSVNVWCRSHAEDSSAVTALILLLDEENTHDH